MVFMDMACGCGIDGIRRGWWNAGMKKSEEIQMLKERVAALESRLTGLEDLLRSVQATGTHTDRMMMTAYERTAELLRLGWEVLHTFRPDFRLPVPGEDPAQGSQRSPKAGSGREADG